MGMSKLLVSIGTLSHGGAERVLATISSSFAEHFDDVIFLTWLKYPVFYPIDPRVRLVCIPDECGRNNRIFEMPWFRSFVKKERPDVILSFLVPFNMIILTSLMGVKQKIVVSERSDPNKISGGKLMATIRNLLYRRADGIITQSTASKACFKGVLAHKTHVIYNPINMSDDLIGAAIKTNKDNVIVTAGRLIPLKRHRMLIDAFATFRYTHPRYKLIIYGDGPERDNLIEHIKDLKLENDVFLPGSVKDFWQQILSAKMFALTSDYEGMPNALFEAMCLGLPCITTKLGGVLDFIKDEKNGLIIDVGDEASLSNAMTRIADDDTFANTMAVNASKVYSDLKLNIISQQWLTYLDSVIKN